MNNFNNSSDEDFYEEYGDEDDMESAEGESENGEVNDAQNPENLQKPKR
jgi:hypothetical protein